MAEKVLDEDKDDLALCAITKVSKPIKEKKAVTHSTYSPRIHGLMVLLLYVTLPMIILVCFSWNTWTSQHKEVQAI